MTYSERGIKILPYLYLLNSGGNYDLMANKQFPIAKISMQSIRKVVLWSYILWLSQGSNLKKNATMQIDKYSIILLKTAEE